MLRVPHLDPFARNRSCPAITRRPCLQPVTKMVNETAAFQAQHMLTLNTATLLPPAPQNAHVRVLMQSNASLFAIQNAPSIPRATPPIITNPIQRLHHNHRISANYTHSQPDFFVVGFAFRGFVEHDVQEDLGILMEVSEVVLERERGSFVGMSHVVAAEGAHDFAGAIELDFNALVEVLGGC